MKLYVERQSHSIGPFFTSPEVALAFYRNRYRHASNCEAVARAYVALLVTVETDIYDEVFLIGEDD